MSNSILTPSMVTREALRILHQKLNFIGNIVRSYDDSFARTGAKIGDTLKIRLPNRYTVRTGAVLNTQQTSEDSVSLQIATQKGVDISFSSAELTLSLDDFSKRILDPAMAVLAANIEADALSMGLDVYNIVDHDGTGMDLIDWLNARKFLNQNLAPMDNKRKALISSTNSPTMVAALKGLFQDASEIAKQYREGEMGRTSGFDWMENTLVSDHTTGTAAKTTGYTVSGATQTGATITVTGGTTTFLKGDIVTFAGCNAVHPESKADLGYLQTFVITADSGASATSLAVSPSIVTSGAKQNVTASPTDTGNVVKVAAGNGETISGSMAFHEEAFCFATADLVMPRGVDFAAREVYDGISMRVVRAYDINNDLFPCRIDVMYGYKTLRPQLACRVHAQ